MSGSTRKPAVRLLALVAALLLPALVRAQDAARVAGAYCLVGVREVGSCLRLAADGRFDYFLAYGAYDEKSEGNWRVVSGEVVIDSPSYDRSAAFAFKELRRGEGAGYIVLVESKAGRSMQGIDVRITCDGRPVRQGYTQQTGYETDCATAPTNVALGLGMYGVGFQPVDVSAHAGADKVYVFEFDPGDLGRKRFAGQRLRREGTDRLIMIYSGSPIRELEGRSFTYERR